MGQQEIKEFLTMRAGERRVAAATHNQASSALLFLYPEILGTDLPWFDYVQREAAGGVCEVTDGHPFPLAGFPCLRRVRNGAM